MARPQVLCCARTVLDDERLLRSDQLIVHEQVTHLGLPLAEQLNQHRTRTGRDPAHGHGHVARTDYQALSAEPGDARGRGR